MATNDARLRQGQRRAIAALLSTRTLDEAARQAGVSSRTLDRWLTEPAFQKALSEAERKLIATSCRRLVHYQEYAVTVIAQMMADAANPPAVRLRAAQILIENMLRLRELTSIEDRLAALEEAAARRYSDPPATSQEHARWQATATHRRNGSSHD